MHLEILESIKKRDFRCPKKAEIVHVRWTFSVLGIFRRFKSIREAVKPNNIKALRRLYSLNSGQ